MDPKSHPPNCTCTAHPLPVSMRVRDARDAYLAENGFTTESYDAPTTAGSFLGVKFSVPNPPPHQRAIRLHDLHHVATGFGTDHAGEASRGSRGGSMRTRPAHRADQSELSAIILATESSSAQSESHEGT